MGIEEIGQSAKDSNVLQTQFYAAMFAAKLGNMRASRNWAVGLFAAKMKNTEIATNTTPSA